VRIIAGEKRGAQLSAPKGRDTRPTLDRVKESLFGILQFDIYGKRVLDLFAGSGALGLEALSRGAEYAAFCDSSRQSVAAVGANIQKLGYGQRSKVYACDCFRAIDSMRGGEGFDIAFLDPPYAAVLAQRAAEELYANGLMRKGFIMAIEHGPGMRLTFSGGLEVYDVRRYGGNTAISFVRELL